MQLELMPHASTAVQRRRTVLAIPQLFVTVSVKLSNAMPDASFTVRLRAPDDGEVVNADLIQGDVRIKARDIDDLVLLRADGNPTDAEQRHSATHSATPGQDSAFASRTGHSRRALRTREIRRAIERVRLRPN